MALERSILERRAAKRDGVLEAAALDRRRADDLSNVVVPAVDDASGELGDAPIVGHEPGGGKRSDSQGRRGARGRRSGSFLVIPVYWYQFVWHDGYYEAS